MIIFSKFGKLPNLCKHPTPFQPQAIAPASAVGWGVPIRLD